MTNTMTVPRVVALVLAGIGAAATQTACAPEVPADPTWTEDVRPILMGNCVRCHSSPSLGGAPCFVRLDKFEDEDRGEDCDGVDGNNPVYGAGFMASFIRGKILDDLMPPMFPLPARQRDILIAWGDVGSGELPLKGEPLPGNRPPTMDLLTDFEEDGGVLVARYAIDDLDFDLVTGRLTAEPEGDGDPIVITFELFSGRDEIVWDVEGVTSGSYGLVAEIDDGSETVEVDLGSVEVP